MSETESPLKRKYKKEGELVKACVDYLEKDLGLFVWRQNSGTFRKNGVPIRCAIPGCPDIIGHTRGGRFFGVECKVEDGRQSNDQKLFQHRSEASGGLYILAYELDDVADHFQDLTGINPEAIK